MNFTKHYEHPELLRQLALEVIDNIPSQALVLYTDGSRSDSGRTSSGVLMKTNTEEFRYRLETLTTAQFSALSLLLLEKP
ncbi:hypothetical protein TNCT_624691 [Trichonephila clavata]|uniref:Uncharacterized protein n=1 Tax=Trichonephila clavata TaxID=2740835 RepID=A0A8X6HBW4_TRICU|nr:hypothetical protein TNCT_624691 [Trichonephila clavata]